MPIPPEVFDFATVTRKQDLELVLRRAQLATLNPSRDPSEYINIPHLEHASRGAVGFSPNIIQLKVEAPDLPELSVVDLPGTCVDHVCTKYSADLVHYRFHQRLRTSQRTVSGQAHQRARDLLP